MAITSGLVASACVGSDDDVDNSNTAGTGGSSAGTGGDGATGGSTAGTGGDGATGGTSTGGTGGTAPVMPRCMTKSPVPGPTLINFESLTVATDGTVIPESMIQVGTYVYTDPADTTAMSARSLIAGYDATSLQAISTTIHSSTWGGGMGIWLNMPACLDATAFTGISFWVKSAAPPASMPAGTVNFSLNTVETSAAAEGGDCAATPCTPPSYNFVVTDTWQQITVAWGDFTPGVSGTTMVPVTGDNIVGLNFNLGNDNTARDIGFDLDDVTFTQ